MPIKLFDVEQKGLDGRVGHVARVSLISVIPEQCQRCIKRPCPEIWNNDDNSCWHQVNLAAPK